MLPYFCLVTTFLTLVASSVIPEPAGDTPISRKTRGASCFVDGSERVDGSNFTRPSTGLCVYYMCSDGEVLPAGYGCWRGTTCHPPGDVFKLGCIERRCQVTNGLFDYVIVNEGCVTHDGVSCADVGSTFKDGCFTYVCEKEAQSAFSVSYRTRQTDWGCQLGGTCVPLNHTHSQGCTTVQCQRRGLSVGFYPVSEGCEVASECIEVGQSKVVSCRTLTCVRENLNGVSLLNVRPTKIQCIDADGQCHGSGSFFPMTINGARHNCTCEVEGLSIRTDCSLH